MHLKKITFTYICIHVVLLWFTICKA